VTCFLNLSLNGFFEGANHDISWHNVDEEFNQFAIGMLRETDVILFGRRTYELFRDYWPDIPEDRKATPSDLEIAALINNAEKIVFSKTLDKVEEKENWRNVKLLHDVIPHEIEALKQQRTGKLDVGGNDLLVTFLNLKLVDEIQVMINPVLIPDGNSFTRGIRDKTKLKLLETRVFDSGNILQRYEPIRAF
jgi:dihydrofolate reductase